MPGKPRIQISVCEQTFDDAHAKARKLRLTTSEWLRSLLMAADEKAPVLRTKQLSVRLDDFHLKRLGKLATRSQVSRSKVFALLVQQALASNEDAPRSKPHATNSTPKPVIPAHDAYDQWAPLIMQAARDTPHKFGERKAFISGVLDELEARLHPAHPANFRAMIKRILPELNRLGLVPLVRADLVSVMDPALVADSEIRYGIPTFHFVDLTRFLSNSWLNP